MRRLKLNGLKNVNDGGDGGKGGGIKDAALDAEFLDVYVGAHAAVFLFDVTKQWTLDYVEKELKKVPKKIRAVLVLANFLDKSHHRVITRDQAVAAAEQWSEQEIKQLCDNGLIPNLCRL